MGAWLSALTSARLALRAQLCTPSSVRRALLAPPFPLELTDRSCEHIHSGNKRSAEAQRLRLPHTQLATGRAGGSWGLSRLTSQDSTGHAHQASACK